MLNHNKKRNVGLLNEFFARHIANLLVCKQHDAIDKATKLYSKHFLGESQIAQEWKLFQNLYMTNVGSSEVAHSFLSKVRDLSFSSLNEKALEAEKTQLIHEINNSLNDKEFFARAVPDYKIQATIQVLLNSWKKKTTLTESLDLSSMARLEDTLLEHLTKKKDSDVSNMPFLEMNNEEIDGLVVKLMTEKFNQKFAEQLTEDQREIISKYVFLENPEIKAELASKLENIRIRTLKLVENALTKQDEKLGERVTKKLHGFKNMLLNEYKDSTKNISDETVTFYMAVTNLEKELSSQ